jgi:hypothetical protein
MKLEPHVNITDAFSIKVGAGVNTAQQKGYVDTIKVLATVLGLLQEVIIDAIKVLAVMGMDVTEGGCEPCNCNSC